MTSTERELYELVLLLQAEVSALKAIVFQENPELAKLHQTRTDSLAKDLQEQWQKSHLDTELAKSMREQ
jgi:hypothetical protein